MSVRSLFLIGAVCCLLSGCGAIGQVRAMVSTPGDVAIEAMYDTAMLTYEHGDAEGTLIALERAATPDSLAALSELRRHDVLRMYAWSLFMTRHYDAAATAYRQLAKNALASSTPTRSSA